MAYSLLEASGNHLYHALPVAGISISIVFLINLYKTRRRFMRLKRRGLCMPPYNPLLGHLLVAKDILSSLPRDAHPMYLTDQLRRKYPNMGPVFYFDMWPFSTPMLFAQSPSAAYQLIQERIYPKADPVRKFMYPLTKNNDLVTMEGQLWKKWRNVFSPGFSASHLMTLVPRILEEVATFSKAIQEHSHTNDMFSLEHTLINMTMDVIGVVTLGTHFNAQKSDNEFVSALREQILWLPAGSQLDPFQRLNPIRPFAQMYYNYRMNRYLSHEIDSCLDSHKKDSLQHRSSSREPVTVFGLALDRYLEDQPVSESESEPIVNLDARFRKFAISQMKGLILAGHGTTANTICFIYYLLFSHPAVLQHVREEHDKVFGTDLESTPSIIIETPHLLNQLPYTLAVIKETLRLFPTDSSPRRGNAEFSLMEDGCQFPTEGCMVWAVLQAIHLDPRYWPQADTFIPERWLVTKEDPLYPIKGAWRAFEFGPRNCIGQELAVLEMKLALAMTIRKFDFIPSFREWEQIHKMGPRAVNGECAYQTLDGTNRPRNSFPCRVAIRK